MITAYNVVVAVVAFALVLLVHRVTAGRSLAAGLVVFLAASHRLRARPAPLAFLVTARSVQGVGAALLLAGSLPVLVALTGSASEGRAVWTLAGHVRRRGSVRRSAAC